MLYYGIRKRYNHEDLENVYDVLAFSHHFIICEYSMPNFQVRFVRAVVQHWKNICLQAGPFARNLVTLLPFFSEVPYNVQSTC